MHMPDPQKTALVLIVGIGGIGMSAQQGAGVSGARRVIAVDPGPRGGRRR